MTISTNFPDELLTAFQVMDMDGGGTISAGELAQVLRRMGQEPTDHEVAEMLAEVDVDRSGDISFDEFKTLMIDRVGDHRSRLQLAFSIFDEDNSGTITAQELHTVMSQFGLTNDELNEMLAEVDHDGDAAIDFDEFCTLVPEPERTDGDPPFSASAGAVAQPPPTVEKVECTEKRMDKEDDSHSLLADDTEKPLAQESSSYAGVSGLGSQLERGYGTSRLQMQVGLFRLLQGAAYRASRESFSLNFETHLRVRNLPYTITDFVKFTEATIELYKQLGVVDAACHSVLDALVTSVQTAFAQLETRVAQWETVPKTAEMVAEHEAMLAARQKSTNVKEKFSAGVEYAITMKKQKLGLGDVVGGVLATNELHRLRQLEMRSELTPSSATTVDDPQCYLQQWHRVILNTATEEIDGAMMPVAYWYEDFMPKLLAACSVATEEDVVQQTVPHVAALDAWYEKAKAKGEFARYGADIVAHFAVCTPQQKLMIQQAWRLTRHYLNGVQKRRERAEFGRESGTLSQYIAFVDLYLGRSDLQEARMRLSFPYYIGPAVWRLFHTIAEIACTQSMAQQRILIGHFKRFFRFFASMYPCPYCRHHLNAYVVQNREVNLYPVEYLVLGRDPHGAGFEVSMSEKLSTVVDGQTLRLFLWKLHNTVSSSIARSEAWYHQDDSAFYTTRYWPSLDAELARSQAFQQEAITTDRIQRLYAMLKPSARLAGIAAEIGRLIRKNDAQTIAEVNAIAQEHIQALEDAVLNGEFLQETYSLDLSQIDPEPELSPQEEIFSRSGYYVEDG